MWVLTCIRVRRNFLHPYWAYILSLFLHTLLLRLGCFLCVCVILPKEPLTCSQFFNNWTGILINIQLDFIAKIFCIWYKKFFVSLNSPWNQVLHKRHLYVWKYASYYNICIYILLNNNIWKMCGRIRLNAFETSQEINLSNCSSNSVWNIKI